MAEKARHAFGSSANVDNALSNGTIDNYDILFLDGDTDNPKVGWIDKNGKKVIVASKSADISGIEEEISTLGEAVATKADAATVEAELATKATTQEVETMIETAIAESVVVDVVEF